MANGLMSSRPITDEDEYKKLLNNKFGTSQSKNMTADPQAILRAKREAEKSSYAAQLVDPKFREKEQERLKFEQVQDIEARKNQLSQDLMLKQKFGETPEIRAQAGEDLAKLNTGGEGGGPTANQYAAAGMAINAIPSSGQGSSADTLKATGAGAATGASIGTAITPGVGTAIGAGIGAAVGLTGGLMSASAARKQKMATAKSKSLENIAKIEEDSETKRQQAFSGMVTALRSAFLG